MLNLRLKEVIRVNPCRPLVCEVLHMRCANLNLGEVHNSIHRYQVDPYIA